MDYSKIEASPVWGPEIGRLYMKASPFVTSLARRAYGSLARQVDAQFGIMTEVHGIQVTFTKDDPGYADASDMFEEIERGSFKVWYTTPEQRHPLLSDMENARLRAVHDYFGHFGTRRGFDRHGEEAAWVRHSRMFTGLGRRAMTTETRGQNSALCWLLKGTGEFPPQKAVLLPDWVSEIPRQWS